MSNKVIDTNVPIIANGNDSPQASPACQLACNNVLRQLFSGDIGLIIDTNWYVIKEYQRNLRVEMNRGLGDAFLKWVVTNLTNSERIIRVPITQSIERGFDEFPDDARLTTFDPADRKWIAIAASFWEKYQVIAPIAQGFDPKWANFVEAFAEYQIIVEFLCESNE